MALRRLLLKLKLINEQLVDRESPTDLLPIGFFAACRCFDERKAIALVAKELGLESRTFDRSSEQASLALLDQPVFAPVDLATWREARAIPLQVSDDEILLCMADPLDFAFVRRLEFILQRKIKAAIGQERQILDTLSAQGKSSSTLDFNELFQEEKEDKPAKIENRPETQNLESNITKEDIAAPTVIKLVNRIFAASIQQGASDIHITPEASQVHVRIRVDGILRDFLKVPQVLARPLIARIKVLCGMDITEKRQPQDARLRLKTNSGLRDMRISTIPTAYAEDIVIRVLSSELGDISVDTLGMPDSIKKGFCAMLRTSSKVHLVTGPTGSGKTSTLYAGLLFLRDGKTRIITIEDPIEYRIQGVSQIQVNSKIEMTFAKALRSVLRQDPDIVLVGEIRDGETAITATQVAQTGHLVLSTLHTNNAIAAITRLRDLGIQPFLISSSLGSITAQRLVRRLCLHCQEQTSAAEIAQAKRFGVSPERMKRAKGCEECGRSGFQGRIGIFSFLEITPQIAQAIHDNASEEKIESLARSDGYVSLEEAGLRLVEQGVTTFQELERIVGPLDKLDSAKVRSPSKEDRVKEDKGLAPALPAPILPMLVKKSAKDGGIQKRKVLLVDDDPDLRMIYNDILQLQMFDVVQANDGVQALDAVYREVPDVIVLDVMMPKMGGMEVVERLRSDPQTRKIPVLMLTASAAEELELDLLKKGADDFVSKTARSEVIVARINRLANRLVE